eukprot:EG_transcript_4255
MHFRQSQYASSGANGFRCVEVGEKCKQTKGGVLHNVTLEEKLNVNKSNWSQPLQPQDRVSSGNLPHSVKDVKAAMAKGAAGHPQDEGQPDGRNGRPSGLGVPAILKPGVLAKVQLCGPPSQPCSATCADGSPPVFYYRGGDPKRVVIWLQGGGFCSSLGRTDCFWGPCSDWRWSSNWTQPRYSVDEHHQGRGILRSGGPLAGWTMVFAIYCDGVSFLGNRTSKGLAASHGARILKGIFQRVLGEGSETGVTEVILGGTSAGGLATIHQCNSMGDYVTRSLRSLRSDLSRKH